MFGPDGTAAATIPENRPGSNEAVRGSTGALRRRSSRRAGITYVRPGQEFHEGTLRRFTRVLGCSQQRRRVSVQPVFLIAAWVHVAKRVKHDETLAANLAEYNERRAKSAPNKAADQWKLALWCEEKGLKAEA